MTSVLAPPRARKASRIWLAAVVAALTVTTGCSYLFGPDRPQPYTERDIAPTPTQDPAIAMRWLLDRDQIPVREDWFSDGFHEQFEGCRDRGFGGRTRTSFTFIDLPPEPHTPEVVRAAIAEHLCYAGRPNYAPPGRFTLVQGHFTTVELKGWAWRLRDIFDGIEVAGMGTGNAFNRINVRLIDLADEYEARERIEAAGIPQHAVHFEQGGHFIPILDR